YTITVVVIDKIALSTSDVTIPVGGTIDLNATATDISTSDSWEWISNNPDIAKVEGKGVTAVVKGVAAGETTVVVKHTVGGVIKSATAKVRVTSAVTKITLTPAETTIEVDKIASIRADVTPKTSGGSYLYWRSSNPEIVKIDDENNHTAVTSVTGKAPGIAIIMAVNKENVILGSAKVTVSSPVTGIILSQSVVEKPLSDKTYQIVATVAPKEATNTKLTWKSSNDKVAQVDANGLVTFKKAGHVSIIAASVSNPQITASCDITIVKTVDSIKLETAEISLAVGETYKLSPTISPEDASNKNLNYKSMDPKIADVNKTGLITAKQAGSAHIIVSTPDGKITANCTVKVTQKATGMKLSATVLILDVGASHTLEVTFNPKTTTDTKVLWTISDKSVAKVDAKGKVVAISAGEALITAKSSNGLTAVCKVKVNQPVGKIELNYTEYDLAVDDELELEVTFDNDDVTNKKVKWKSSKPDVASVDKNGLVKGKKGGIAIITVTADENGMQANCVVTVEEPISEIKLNKTSYILGYHKSFLLKATLKTNSATNKKLKWSSSKNSVASVNKSGQVYGKKPGFATIKVKATDGSGAEATARIRVVREAGSISANPSFLAMIVGRRKKIKVKISPKNATIKTAKFKSENTDVAMVDSKGRVTALAAGKTKINILAKDNSGKKQAVVVHVRDYIPAAKLTLSNTTLTMGIGDKQSTVYSITPSNTDDKVKWSTNNKAVATVNKKGLITGVGSGNATITASTTSGKTAQIAVTVVGLNFNTLTLEQYDTYKLSVIGDVKNVSWDSENPEIATVENGLVKAKKPGSTTILARVNGAVLRCKIVVNNIQ
ncbi:MAG: Ig-like domain-containing protein, partial [Catonella sp.]|uniref:Ig-like domain-containing protein n=1 Tax=Catonella sp. TaxID=2382125 RepID=UPI003FA0561F